MFCKWETDEVPLKAEIGFYIYKNKSNNVIPK